jgi:formamidase
MPDVRSSTAGVRVTIDPRVPLAQQPATGHNRWHPEIAPLVRERAGEPVTLETRDALDGQITERTTAASMRDGLSLGPVHPLTGPVYVEGAEPGDLLAVEIERIEPQPFGFTVIIPGFGFLRDVFTEPFVVRWRIAEGFAVSDDLPGVRIPGSPFMGVMGTAPSAALMREIVRREAELLQRGGAVVPPGPEGAVPSREPIASEALRTIAPHENGGNVDIKQLGAGTKLFLPVYVPGALFSTGDAHFAQGDCETCGTAIEMGATFTARFEVQKGEAKRRNQTDVSFERTEYYGRPEFIAPRRFHATTGTSVRKDGVNESENLTVAARNALLNMIAYLGDAYGFSREQAYCLCSVAVDLKVSQVVDVPNFIVSAFLPLDVFQ